MCIPMTKYSELQKLFTEDKEIYKIHDYTIVCVHNCVFQVDDEDSAVCFGTLTARTGNGRHIVLSNTVMPFS